MAYTSKSGFRKTKRHYISKYGNSSGKRTYRKKKFYSKIKEFIVKSTPIKTPFPDEFVCKVKSWITLKMQSQGSAEIYSDMRFDNSIHTLGRYQTGGGIVDIAPVGGKGTQEGVSQLGTLYNNYVVQGLKFDLTYENNDAHSIIVYSFPYYPGTNYNGPSVPFTTKVEDDPRVKAQYISPQTQGTMKICKLKRYLTPQYAYNNGYIKGDPAWSSLVSSDPSRNWGLGVRVQTADRTGVLDTDVIVFGYITAYVKFFNKKNV